MFLNYQFRSQSLLAQIMAAKKLYGPTFDRARVEAHTKMAQIVQDAMATALSDKIAETGRFQADRPDHPTGALLAAIKDQRNRNVTPGGLSVGIPDWLSSSPAAKYWRKIDAGAPSFLGHAIFLQPGGPTPPRPELARTQARMPLVRQGMASLLPVSIGPFPAYDYIGAGVQVGQALNKFAIYETVLGAYGITVTRK